MEDPNVVNPRLSVPDMVGNYQTAYTPPQSGQSEDYHDVFNNILYSNPDKSEKDFPAVPGSQIDASGKYPLYYPGRNNEEMYAQNQSWANKMVHGIGKGLALTGTTFLANTAGLVNGLVKWKQDGKFSSFFDNDFNRSLDKFNEELENKWANYYSEQEKNSPWYSPKSWFTANFLWDAIVKNLGFSAGSALAGLAYAGVLRGIASIPGLARIVSVGKFGQALAKSESALAEASSLSKSLTTFEQGAKNFLSSYNVLNPGQRAVVAGLATSGEAAMEAYNNRQQFIQNEIANYEKVYHSKPTGEELQKIINAADGVGNSSYLINIALLTVTNYIQFPKILGSSYNVEKRIVNGLTQEAKNVEKIGEKHIIKPSNKFLSKINKIRPFTFSTSESIEEGSQFVTQTGTQDFFDKKYKGEDADAIESMIYGIGQTLGTKEGMQNVLIGGISGAWMMARGNYREQRNESRVNKAAVGEFNKSKFSDFVKDTYDAVSRGTVLQEERLEAIRTGDIQESKDIEQDYTLNYLLPRVKYGRLDLVRADIDDQKQLVATDEGFAQLQKEGKILEGDTREAYLNRINNFEKTLDRVKLFYQTTNLRYGGQTITDEKGRKSPKYPIDKMIYAAAKIADYDERIASLLPKLTHPDLISKGINIDDIVSELSEGKYEKFNQASAAIKALQYVEKDEIGQALDDVAEMSLRRSKFFKEYEEMKSAPEKYVDKKTEPLPPDEIDELDKKAEEEETIELETIKGKAKFAVGKSYFLGATVDYDKNGTEKAIEIPEFKIVKDNGETIDILTGKGEVKTISKDVFKKYHVSSLESLKTDDNANYFYHHRNEKFEFNFGKGKDGKPRVATGRIEYKDGKLFFVYTKYIDKKTNKPILGRIEVNREQFFAQEGFTQPMIRKVGEILTKEQREAYERLVDEKKRKEDNKRIEESTRVRNNLLTELFVELSEKQKALDELINRKKAELKNIIDGLDLLREDIESAESVNKAVKKTIRFKKHAKKYLEASFRLSRMKDDIELEIGSLENQKRDIDIALAYIEDVSHYAYEASPDVEEFTRQIQEQIGTLELTAIQNTKQISRLNSLLSKIEGAIDKLMNMLHSLVTEFEEKYPKAPNAIIGQQWVDFIKSNPNFLKVAWVETEEGRKYIKPDFREDLKLLEDIIAETEEFEINPKEKAAQAVRESIDELQKEITDIEPELIGLRAILHKFEPYVKQAEQKRKEEQKLSKDSPIIESEAKSNKAGIRNADLNKHDKEYEADKKKNDRLVVTSTITTDDGKDHQKRSNLFGARLNKFENRDKIRGVYITSKNEHLLIPGLIDFLLPKDGSINRDSVIALVMVEVDEDSGKVSLIGVDGKPIKETEALEKGIFQVFPEKELTWSEKYGGGSMFRKTTPDDVQNSLRKQYSEWRQSIFDRTEETTDLNDVIHGIDASVGIPNEDESKPLYEYTTSVEDAHLIDENDMHSRIVLEVPTTDDVIEEGSVRFTKALGRVFVKLTNGYVKLQNRKLNKKQAYSVYQAIHRLSELAMEMRGLETEDAKRLFTYLRSVIYYRVPKGNETHALGRNNIFIKKDPKTKILTLYISDDGTSYEFKPSSLEENKNGIIENLQSIFMNVNNHMIKDTNEMYEEITDIKENGEVVSNKWKNYQTYLLSKNDHKGGQRNNDDIPLYVWMKPVVSDDETNRHGIYFYVQDDKEYLIPDYKQKKKLGFTPTKQAPEEFSKEEVKGKRTEEESRKLAAVKVKKAIFDDILRRKEKAKEEDKLTFTLGEIEESGEYALNFDPKKRTGTINVFTTKEGRKVRFVAESNVNAENYLKTIIIYEDGNIGQFEEIVQMFIDAGREGSKEEIKKTKEAKKEQPKKTIEEEESYTVGELDELTEEDKKGLSPEALDALDELKNLKRDEDEPPTRPARDDEAIDVEDWNNVEKWLKKNFPNIPLYRVKNIIKSTSGTQAWGMFKDGALYLYKNAEVGTIYHEVFHAIWRMSTTLDERTKIYEEFRQRSGNFFDAKTGESVKYSDATIKQAEEKLAEEFRDYVHYKKVPSKPSKGRPWIVKFFSDIVNFIKAFITGDNSASAAEELFSKIDTGGYKSFIPYESSLSFANRGILDIEDATATEDAKYSLARVSDKQRAEIIHHMTYLLLKRLVNNDESLFNIPQLKKGELYPEMKVDVLSRLRSKRLIAFVDREWNDIIARHEEYLKSYNIDFDENDHINIHSEENSGKSDYTDARKIDSFRKANSAIKLLLSTIPKTEIGENGKERIKRSTVNGVILNPSSQIVISLRNKLSQSVNIDDMMRRLRRMAEDDTDYRALYKRLMKTAFDAETGHKFEKIKTPYASQLLNAFWNTFKKQNPSVQNIFVLDNGEVITGEASLSTAALQLRDSYEKSIVLKARGKKGESFFKFDKETKKFVGDPITMRGVSTTTPQEMISFLNKLGIEFTGKELNYLRANHRRIYDNFKEAVGGIRTSIINSEPIVTIGGKTLEIKKRLLQLGLAKSIANNPFFDSTYFNVVGERMQSYIGPNAASNLYDFLSNIKNKKELEGTQYEYLLTDSFAQGSNLMERMFDANGNIRDTGRELLKIGYAGGIMHTGKGKSKEPSRLTYMQRLIQEINLNLDGWFLNLVPGDASIEWMVQMGNPVSVASLRSGKDIVYKIFGNYFISEFNLAKEERKNLPEKRKSLSGELRFFREIIINHSSSLYKEIMSKEGDGEAVYKDYSEKINTAIDEYIKKTVERTRRVLESQGVIQEDEKGFTMKDVNLPSHMKEATLTSELTALSINYMIANIETHKLLYSDPYQYWDELKRIKSFLSPRQSLISGSSRFNEVLNTIWNKGFKDTDIGYTNFMQDYFKTTTLADVIAVGEIPGYSSEKDAYEETDGSGIITFKAYRQFRIRVGNWNDREEAQYRHDIEYEKLAKEGATNEELAEFEKTNPKVKSAYTPLKPIVSGNKANGREFNDIVLDKYALYPLSFRIMNNLRIDAGKASTNILSLYNKMQGEKIDYVVFNSGRKVGAEEVNPIYHKNGKFNDSKFKGIVNIPFSIMSLQTEVPSKEDDLVTRGSQATKLITMDFMDAGVPIDFDSDKSFDTRYTAWYKLSKEEKIAASPLFKEIVNNQSILEAMMEDGYTSLLSKLGIREIEEDGVKRYDITDFSSVVKTLKDEMLKRQVNDNLIDAINSFGEETSILESTPAYQQVRNILYSIVDRLIVSPKMPGGLKVQIPSTFMQENNLEYIPKSKAYKSKNLAFYSKTEDGKKVNVCEVMLPRWFKSDLSDKELLDYLNTTDEGKKILRGIGFRIPTQKQNSIDVFVIKQFLPREFGDAVVIPSELVKKAGSDFDIDKLSIYLKNVYTDIDGNIKMVPSNMTKEQVYEAYDKGTFLSPDQKERLQKFIDKEREVGFRKEGVGITVSAENILLRGMFPEMFTDEALTTAFVDEVVDKGLREIIVSRIYKQSLENAYIESSDNLISHPLNFERLTKPNSADDLKKLSEKIATAIHGKTFDYTDIDNMLDRGFMSRLRHAFISGKHAIAISAVSQTNNSLNQRQRILIDPSLMGRVSAEDKQWLGDGEIKFQKINKVRVGRRMIPTLSMTKNAAGEYISDIISQFIDGYVDISKGPWIMELGAFPNVAPTFLFLVKVGVPIEDVAYFINQPIIRDYLRELETQGFTWLFNSTVLDAVRSEYGTEADVNKAKAEIKGFKIPSKYNLSQTIDPKRKLSSQEKIDQIKMLDEFLKYAKMATHLYNMTNATNYDTTTFNDPLLIWKKNEQMAKANATLIDSAQALLNNSFIGKLPSILASTRNAIAKILISDQAKVRSILQAVLTPYINERDDVFLKIAKKATADLFDYAVQTDAGFNKHVKELFDGGAVDKISDFVEKVKRDISHPLHGNLVIDILQINPSNKGTSNSINNIKIKGDSSVYDQNNIIYAFRDIRDFLGEDSEIYRGLINVAVVQSGLSYSGISYTSLIPFEDFMKVYAKTLSRLEQIDLSPFVTNGVFYRTNWNNDDIVTRMNAGWIKTAWGKKVYNISMEYLPTPVKNAVNEGSIPPVITIPKGNREAREDYIFYTWNLMDELLTEKDWIDINNNKVSKYSRIFAIQEEMRKKGDFSYMKRSLFKKVHDEDGDPAIREYKGKKYIIYKAINGWGEGNKSNEFYDTEHESIIDNGLEKVPTINDSDVIFVFSQPDVKTTKKRAGGYMSSESEDISKTDNWQEETNKCETPF